MEAWIVYFQYRDDEEVVKIPISSYNSRAKAIAHAKRLKIQNDTDFSVSKSKLGMGL